MGQYNTDLQLQSYHCHCFEPDNILTSFGYIRVFREIQVSVYIRCAKRWLTNKQLWQNRRTIQQMTSTDPQNGTLDESHSSRNSVRIQASLVAPSRWHPVNRAPFCWRRLGGSAWIASSLWNCRRPNFRTSQSCFLSSNWFSECEHPFIDKARFVSEPTLPSAQR